MAYNILIVDDSEVTRNIMARTLKMCGVDIGEIYFAENGKIGMEKLGEAWPDMVFCDINMPVMDGIQFVNELSQSEEWKDLPVVIVSTEGSQTRMEELRKRGVKGYIRKPFTAEQVSEIIDQLLGKDQHV